MCVNPVNTPVSSTKRKSDGNQRQGERVTNTNMVNDWNCHPGEYYSTVFTHKVKDGPTLLMGFHGCHRFHNKGFFDKYCENSASHCKLVNNYFTLMDKIIKVLNG